MRDENGNTVEPNILIVDDDQINIYVLGALLKKKNLGFDSAMNGTQAIQLVKIRI